MGLAHTQSNIKTSSENQKPDLSDVTNNQASNVNVTTVKTTNNNTTPTTPNQNIVDFYNSLPKEVQEVLGDDYEEYSQYISYTDDGFYFISKLLSEIMISADGINDSTGCPYLPFRGKDKETPVGMLDDHYIAAIKNGDGTYTYTLIKIRPEYDVEGNSDPENSGTAIPFVEFDIDSLAKSMKDGKINDELAETIMACVYGTKEGTYEGRRVAVAADGNKELTAYFKNNNCQDNYLIANITIQKSLESPLYNKEKGEYSTGWTFNQFDGFCQRRLEELEKAGVVNREEIVYKNGNIQSGWLKALKMALENIL